MNSNVINGVLRAVIPSAVSFAVAKGWLPSSSSAPEITAAVITLVAAVWSIVTNIESGSKAD